MHYDPDKHHRRSIRLKDYDYSHEGAYFVTICTHKRECLFGDVCDGAMALNTLGQFVADTWQRLATFHPHLEVSTFIVMPNHLHGILVLHKTESQQKPIGQIIGPFKSFSTKTINQRRDTPGAAVWQRNYYERIIRNEAMLNAISLYIAENPSKWSEDNENPNRHNDRQNNRESLL